MEIVKCILLTIAVFVEYIDAACPNLCNNNGLCGINNACLCHEGFTGPDCSQRICPYGTAWADKTTAIDTAHADSECSGAGLCDTSRGECRCFEGFTGHACQRSKCHNNCNNRGQCVSMADMSLYHGKDYDPTSVSSGDGFGAVYTNWEKNSMMTCKCDYGFFGPDCSLIMCPKGDDPVTVNQVYRQIQLDVTDPGSTFTGQLGITFQGETSYITLGAPTSSNCETTLEANPKFSDVTCTYTSVSASVRRFAITFVSWPRLPKENNLYFHEGNPAITDFLCDVSKTDSTVTCAFTDLVNTNLREYEYCSNRGICDFTTGNCLCATGYGGLACDTTHTTYLQTTNARVFREVAVKSTNYNSSAINIETVKSSSPDFKLFEAKSNSKSFYVLGNGVVGADSMRVIESGMTVQKGGVMVSSGGVNVTADGAVVINAEHTSPTLSTQTTDVGFDDTVLETRSMGLIGRNHYIMRATNQGLTRFAVRGDGQVEIQDVGLTVTGGVSVASGGLTARAGITVHDDGLTVTGGVSITSGDVTISDQVDIYSLGMTVRDGATIETGGVAVVSGGLGVELAGQTITAGGLMVTAGGATIASGGILVTGGFTVQSGGATVTDGMTVSSAGLKVSDGISVMSSGTKVEVTGLSIIQNGGVVSNGLTVHSDGLKVTGGMSLYSGLVVEANGASVAAGGVTVQNGLYVNSGGLHVDVTGAVITGGLTVLGGGLKVTSGVTVDSGGMFVTNGGVTLSATGMKVSGGLTVLSTGLQVDAGGVLATGGMTVQSSGVNIIGSGFTVVDGGFVATAGGGTVSGGGLKVTGGLSVVSGVANVLASGIGATGGLSVENSGASVKGGITIVDTGLYVLNTGMTVSANGMTVADGVTAVSGGVQVVTGGVKLTGGLTMQDTGLTFVGAMGMTLMDAGLGVDGDGVTINTGGMKVAGGVTVSSGGIDIDVSGTDVAGGITVHSDGMKVAGGMTLANTGIAVSAGGATITAGGLKVAGGVSISTNGVDVEATGIGVTGGLTVLNGGMKVTGGITVPSTLQVSGGGGTVAASGMAVQNGITVDTSNLVINDHLQVGGTFGAYVGAKVAGGVTLHNSNLRVDAGGVSITGQVNVLQSMTITGNIYGDSLVVTSDRRLKSDLEPLKDNLDQISKLRGVYFNWREDSVYANETQRQIGVIAQDIQEVYPEATTSILDDEYLGVDYTQLIPVLVEAIRELSDNYQDLSDTYDELNSRTSNCDEDFQV